MGMVLTLADVIAVAAAALAAQAAEKKQRASIRTKTVGDPVQTKPRLGIHGGSNIMQTIATGRHFIFRKGLPLHLTEFASGDNASSVPKPTWIDENIRVWALPIERDSSSQSLEDRDQSNVLSSSPRKRDLNDFLEVQGYLSAEASEPKNLHKLDDQNETSRLDLLRSTISSMFDSDWRLDSLIETDLSQVRMPAAIFFRDKETNRIEIYKGPLPGSDESLPDIKVLVRKPWPGALVAELPPTRPSATSMCYIVRVHPQRGKFDVQKARALNVKPGPDFKELTDGNPVISRDGQTVLPQQVLGPGDVGAGFAIIEVPSSEYILDLINRREWASAEIMEGVGAVIWNLGPGVVADERLQRFIQEHDGLKHIISSPEHSPNCLSMNAASAATIRHSLIDPERFGIPVHDNRALALPSALSQCTIAQRGQSIQVAPFLAFNDSSRTSVLNTATTMQEMPLDIIDMARAIRQDIESERVQEQVRDQNLPSPEAEIISLGTGSALPSKYRNVSATLLRVPGSGSYLLDCGENTLGQLSRIYSSEELSEVLRDLKMIWISHMHADHHLGTTSVIKAWYQAIYGIEGQRHHHPLASLSEGVPDLYRVMTEQKRLFVASEPAMIKWLNEYATVEDYGHKKLVLLEVKPNPTGKYDSTEMLWNTTPLGFSTPQSNM